MTNPDDAALIAAAREAATRAYAPYSNFHVGAAVLTADGKIFAAANVENASYGLSLCAETNAVMAAASAGARAITRIAVIGYPAGEPDTAAPAMPCGRCRQIMVEFAPREAGVLLIAPDGSGVREIALGELLPHAFDAGALG